MGNQLQIALAACVALLSGCGTKPVTGGTPGVLTYRGKFVSDIRVIVHRAEGTSSEPIGFGVTANDGTFQLVTNEARGPLRLSPGDYRCTLESVGPPIQVPKEYTKADSTPLRVSWSAGNKSLDLEFPAAASQ